MTKNVLSVFDGISGLRLALKRNGIKINNYYASEIEESAIAITQARFPDTIQLGDIRNVPLDLKNIWLISAGSPCQDLSMMGKRSGMKTAKGEDITSLEQYLRLKEKGHKFAGQSYLFWEFIRLVRHYKPKYFFLENVGRNNKWMYIISKELKVLPMVINSSLVSAQNRKRYYWTNIPDVTIPKDKKIFLSHVIPGAVTGYGTRGRLNKLTGKYDKYDTARIDRKANCICTKAGTTCKAKMRNGSVRKFTVTELEKLQTLPKDYTKVKGVSQTDRIKGIGNGWTIDMIAHLLKPLKKQK